MVNKKSEVVREVVERVLQRERLVLGSVLKAGSSDLV